MSSNPCQFAPIGPTIILVGLCFWTHFIFLSIQTRTLTLSHMLRTWLCEWKQQQQQQRNTLTHLWLLGRRRYRVADDRGRTLSPNDEQKYRLDPLHTVGRADYKRSWTGNVCPSQLFRGAGETSVSVACVRGDGVLWWVTSVGSNIADKMWFFRGKHYYNTSSSAAHQNQGTTPWHLIVLHFRFSRNFRYIFSLESSWNILDRSDTTAQL